MDWLLTTVATGVATATATTFDDNLYLTLFFSRTNRRFRPHHIVLGEFIGFSVLIAISLIGFLLGRSITGPWIGLLGLLPILIGIHSLQSALPSRQRRRRPPDAQPAGSEGSPPRQRWGQWLQAAASPSWSDSHHHDTTPTSRKGWTLWKVLTEPRTYAVSAVTIANGGNNIAIYMPLFATCTLPKLLVILAICYTAIGIWCLNSYLLYRQPQIAARLSRIVASLVPWVLISLGISILLRNGTSTALANLAMGS